MAAPTVSPPQIPPLKEGDRLTRDEFERRYNAMPDLKKAELLEGVVYLPFPVRFEGHGSQHSNVDTWLGVYAAYTPGVEVGNNSSIRLDLESEPQPDVVMLIQQSCGGNAQLSTDGYLELAPELVAEISGSTLNIDTKVKFRIYQRNKVREYLVWRVEHQAIDWFVLRGDTYQLLAPSPAGQYRSENFPGLWLDIAAMLRKDMARVLQVLQEGIASPEHAKFVERLSAAQTRA